MNKILVNYIENNKPFKEKLYIEEYENLIKINTEINKLNEYINNNQNEISNLKRDNK